MKKVKCVATEVYYNLTVDRIYDVFHTNENEYLIKDDLNTVYWHCKSKFKEEKKDTVVESVIQQFDKRSNVGIQKYGVTMDRDDLSPLQWLQHLQEELMDATLYVEKLKQKL